MIFQHFNLLNSKTVFNNVAMPLILQGTSKEKIKAKVDELLKFVGLEDKGSNILMNYLEDKNKEWLLQEHS